MKNVERRMSPFFYGVNEEILSAAFSDVRKGYRQKNEYVVRPSPLDDFVESNTLSKSLFIGIYHTLLVIIMIYVINGCLIRLADAKTAFDLTLFWQLTESSITLIIVFILCSTYLLIAFFLHKLVVITNMNLTLAKWISYIATYGILLIPLWIRFNFKYFPLLIVDGHLVIISSLVRIQQSIYLRCTLILLLTLGCVRST